MTDVVRVPPLALCVAAAAAQRALVRSARPGRPRAVASAVLGVGALAFLAAPAVAFRRRGTTVDPREGATPAALVTDGANAVSRNPMYVGMAGLLAAHALRLGRPRAGLPLVAFVVWMDRVQIPAEERVLVEEFGSAYDDYRRQVPRWLGA